MTTKIIVLKSNNTGTTREATLVIDDKLTTSLEAVMADRYVKVEGIVIKMDSEEAKFYSVVEGDKITSLNDFLYAQPHPWAED